MSEGNGYSGAQVVLAFLAGALTGTCVALLAAPQSGSETRGALREWTREAGGKATRLPEALRHAYREATRAAGRAFNEALADRDAGKD
jgi:gas vesicle protein